MISRHLVLFVCAWACQCALSADYFVQLKSGAQNGESTPREFLTWHLKAVKEELPNANVYQVYWSLAERLGLFVYCVSIDNGSAQLLNISKNIKGIEPIGTLHVSNIESSFSMPSDQGIHHTLSPFRRKQMPISEVSLDSHYSVDEDSSCVYDETMYSSLIAPFNTSALHSNLVSNPVHTYVLDTGIQGSHRSFDSTVEHGFDFENRVATTSSFQHDPHGHGTQVAGVLHQVCSNARVIDVRVLGPDGSGRSDDIVSGLQFAMDHYFDNMEEKGRLHSVINLSFSGKSSKVLRNVLHALSKRVLVVAASGDDDTFSCEVSPSNSESILTVGGASRDSSLPLRGSNYGSCVRVRVVAEHIIAPFIGESDEEMRTVSGSSVAASFLTGVAARLISAIHTTPRAADILYSMFPGVEKQRLIVEYLMDTVTAPAVEAEPSQSNPAHSEYSPLCALGNTSLIHAAVARLLEMSKRPLTTSVGGRRALERVKSRFKESQRKRLDSEYS